LTQAETAFEAVEARRPEVHKLFCLGVRHAVTLAAVTGEGDGPRSEIENPTTRPKCLPENSGWPDHFY
jgi:hypothetical protein